MSAERVGIYPGYKPSLRFANDESSRLMEWWGMDNVGLPIHGPLPFKHAVWFGTKPSVRGEVAVIAAEIGITVMNTNSTTWRCGYANIRDFPDIAHVTARDTEVLDALASHAQYPTPTGEADIPSVVYAFAGATALLSGEYARHEYLRSYVSRQVGWPV